MNKKAIFVAKSFQNTVT